MHFLVGFLDVPEQYKILLQRREFFVGLPQNKHYDPVLLTSDCNQTIHPLYYISRYIQLLFHLILQWNNFLRRKT